MNLQTGMVEPETHFKKGRPSSRREGAEVAPSPAVGPHDKPDRIPLIPSDAAVVRLPVRSALVYVAEADHGVKIGITIGEIEKRLTDLARASGLHPVLVRTWRLRSRSDAWQTEQIAHWLLRDTRTVGEWFHCHPFEAVEAVERALRRGETYLAYLRHEEAA